MNIENEQISDITVSVCQEMLGMDIEKRTSPNCDTTPDHIASICITGEKQALIQVATCEHAAHSISSAMFGTEANELNEAEISDAVCEIVNMIGGNVKGILDCECSLSIPCFSKEPESLVTDGSEAVAFDLSGGTLQVICKEQNTVQS